MRVIHEWGKYVSLEQDGIERLRYNYFLADNPKPLAPKPFFHPVRTPEGVEITANSPLDHFWHHGHWFTWKFVNGVNYWEENQAVVGRQVTLAPPSLMHFEDDKNAVTISSEIAWRDDNDGVEKTRLFEERMITCRLVEDGAMVLDWEIEQTPLTEDVVLDRTPFTTWGGYSGVVVRMTQSLHKQSIVFDDGTETDRPTGQSHHWGAIQGQLDFFQDRHAAVVFMPSPKNQRSPEPMYGNVRPFSNFFGPAPLFHEPLALPRGETLHHACRVLIVPRRVDPTEVDGYYQEWRTLCEVEEV